MPLLTLQFLDQLYTDLRYDIRCHSDHNQYWGNIPQKGNVVGPPIFGDAQGDGNTEP